MQLGCNLWAGNSILEPWVLSVGTWRAVSADQGCERCAACSQGLATWLERWNSILVLCRGGNRGRNMSTDHCIWQG